MAPIVAPLFDFLSHWFVEHTAWTALIVGVIVGTIVITVAFDQNA